MSKPAGQQKKQNFDFYQTLLEEKDFHYLPDFLAKEKEIELFRTIKEYALKKVKNGRIAKPQLLKKYQINISLVPPSRLAVVCALDEKGQIKPTALGEIIKALYLSLEKSKIEGYLFLTSGGAKEALGIKPEEKSRLTKDKNLSLKDYNPKSGPPLMDGDFLFIVDQVDTKMETIAERLKRQIKGNPLEIMVIASKSRPFTRIDIGKIYNPERIGDENWSQFWQSYGHFVPPEFQGIHSFRLSFLHNLMGVDDGYPYIMIIPTDTPQGFIGAHIDFFNNEKHYQEIYYPRNTNLGILKPVVINWFDIAFPFKSSTSEAVCHLWHCLKSSTWDNRLTLAVEDNYKQMQVTLKNRSSKRNKKIKEYSLKTSLRFAQELIYPFALNKDKIIKNTTQMWQWTDRLFKTLKSMLNGDPYLGLIYLLAAGENPTDAPVYGTGFIDPQGFFPELYEFLHDGDRLDRLIRLMAETEEGPALKGWPAFLNFIYQETGFDLKKTARLLNPNFCSLEVYPTLVEDFIKKDLNPISA